MPGNSKNQELLFIAEEHYSKRHSEEIIPPGETWVVVGKQGSISIVEGGQGRLPSPHLFAPASVIYKLRLRMTYTENIKLFEATESSLWLQVQVLVTLSDPLAYVQSLRQDFQTFLDPTRFLHESLADALEHLLSLTPQAGQTLVSPLAAQDLQPVLLYHLLPTGDVTPFISSFLEFRQHGFKAQVRVQGIEPSFTYGNTFRYVNAQLGRQAQNIANWLIQSVSLDFANEVLSLQKLYTAYTSNVSAHRIEDALEQVLRGRSRVIYKVLLKDLLSPCLRASLARLQTSLPIDRHGGAFQAQQELVGPSTVPPISALARGVTVVPQNISSADTLDLVEALDHTYVPVTKSEQSLPARDTTNPHLPVSQAATSNAPDQKLPDVSDAVLPVPPQLIGPSQARVGEDRSSHTAFVQPSLALPQNSTMKEPEALIVPEHDRLHKTSLEMPKNQIVSGPEAQSLIEPPSLILPQDTQVGAMKDALPPIEPPSLILPQDTQVGAMKDAQSPVELPSLTPPQTQDAQIAMRKDAQSFVEPPSLTPPQPQDAQVSATKGAQPPVKPPSLTPPQPQDTQVGATKDAQSPFEPPSQTPPENQQTMPILAPPDLSISYQKTTPTLILSPQQYEDRSTSRYITAKLTPLPDQDASNSSPFSQQEDFLRLPPPSKRQPYASVSHFDAQLIDESKSVRTQQIAQLYSEGGRRWRISPPEETLHETLYVDIGDPYTVLVEIPEHYPDVPPIIEAENTNLAEKLSQISVNRIVQPLFFQHGYSLYQLIAAIADDLRSGSFWLA